MVIPFIGAALSAVASAVASLGPAVASFAGNVLPTLAPYLAKGLDIMQKVAEVAESVALVTGLLKPGERLSEMGERALHAAASGVTPEQFSSFDEYLMALRQQPLDPDRKYTSLATLTGGLAVVSAGLDDRLGLSEGAVGGLWPLVAADSDYFTAGKIIQLIRSGQDIGDVVMYFSGKLGGAESLKVEDVLVSLDQALYPDADEDTLRTRVYQTQESCQRAGEG